MLKVKSTREQIDGRSGVHDDVKVKINDSVWRQVILELLHPVTDNVSDQVWESVVDQIEEKVWK